MGQDRDPLDDSTDVALIARWKAGDERAATMLVERHAPALARFAISLGERADVKEVVQDTFVRAFGSIDSFRADSALRTWLFTIERRLKHPAVVAISQAARQDFLTDPPTRTRKPRQEQPAD